MSIDLQLQQLGLTAQESKVYIACLKLGSSKASEIAQKSQVSREAVYYILKLLHEKGYVSEFIKSGVKYYSAVSPKKILELIETDKERKRQALTEILPELESLQKTALSRPIIEVYEGVEGFKTITSIILDSAEQELCAFIPEKIMKFLPAFHPQFRRKRKEGKISIKAISSKSKELLELQKHDKEELRELRFHPMMKNVDSVQYILPTGIVFIRANEKEQLGIYIKDNAIAQLQKQAFLQIWKQAEK